MAKLPAKKRPKVAKVKAQFAALPWRRTPNGELEILVITSRETHRSVIPKGWANQRLIAEYDRDARSL